MSEILFTDSNFEQEVLKSDIPVLVDFWGHGCMPCMQVAPIIEELADDMIGKVKIGKLNVMDNPEIAGKYRIMSIPSLLFFKNGKVVDQMMGVHHKAEIMERLKSL